MNAIMKRIDDFCRSNKIDFDISEQPHLFEYVEKNKY